MNTHPKRLIEVDLPIKRISEHARREKSIRHGHISTLHIWWARRPLAACRAVICAALWPDPGDELCPTAFREKACKEMQKWTTHDRQAMLSAESRSRFEKARQNPAFFKDTVQLRGALLDFIADFANWDNSTIKEFLDTSRALTQAAHEALGGAPGTRPLAVDPFAGGGSIPLEALRVGADAFASDLNPVAVLLNKVVLEYIPKYGQRLADEVRKWGRWVKEQLEKELVEFYPKDSDGAVPIAYLWARTILSEAPSQDNIPVEIPLLRSLWIAKSKGRRKALRWVRDTEGQVQTRIENVAYGDGISREVKRPLLEIFEPQSEREVESGTCSGGSATCPVSGFTVPVERVRKQLMQRAGGGSDARLIIVVTKRTDGGRAYRLPMATDLAPFLRIESCLNRLITENSREISIVPNEKLNHLRGFFNVVLYGMATWADLFSSRQLLSLITFIKYIRDLGISQCEKIPSELHSAILLCLALALDKQADRNSTVCRWISQNENIGYTFGRQALPMVWDFIETSPLESSGAWEGIIEDIAETLETQSVVRTLGKAEQASATSHLLPDNIADYLFTDPPYYSAVPYADLSDFFYVWLRRTMFKVYPDLFNSPLSPKDEECVVLSHRAAMYRNKDSLWFESMMRQACNESRRLTKQNGIGCFVFANKETRGWESMLAAIIESGWMVTGSWPIDTERPGRLRAQNSAALASSIHIICRPRENYSKNSLHDNIGDWRQVLAELPRRIHEWMPRLSAEGIVGADAIFSCLGPALEIFSCYPCVEKASGEQVTLKEYLEQVWAAVAKEALNMIFEGADATGFEEDARLTAMWLWTLSTGYNGNGQTKSTEGDEEIEEDEDSVKLKKITSGYALEYDAARKIAQGLGAHLEKLGTVVEVKGDTAHLLPVSERTRFLFGKDETQSPSPKRKRKEPQLKLGFMKEIDDIETKEGWGAKSSPKAGSTVLDRLHQSMILFAAGRSEALKRFLVEEGAGNDQRFWRLAQALSALYPKSSDEKRWVDGVLARKKGLGF